MRIAIISDIHGNMEAFTQVLADIDRSNVDIIYSLGDNIGYGPEPGQVIVLIRNRDILSVMGNHELAIEDPTFLKWFNPLARTSLEKTFDFLSEDSKRFIHELEKSFVYETGRFVHGFPPDSPLIYLFQVKEEDLYRVFSQMEERICFVGHTHFLEFVESDGRVISHALLTKGIHTLEREKKYIINIGSVGQPRDGNNNAKYVIWDNINHTIDVRFIPYDIAAVVKKILATGLPAAHAVRLW